MKALLLILITASVQGATPFVNVMKNMKPVDHPQVLETKVTDPLWRDLQVQFRTAAHERLELGDRMTLKLNLLAWGQRQNEVELNRAYEKLAGVIDREGSGGECFYRGLLWSNAFTAMKSLRIHERLAKYYEDQSRILKRGIGENLYEFKELLTLKENEVKNRIAITELKTKLASIQKSLGLRLDNEVELNDVDFGSFINVSTIKGNQNSSEPRLIELEKLKTLAHIHSLELEIEKKEANQIFNNVELYRWGSSTYSEVSYGLQVTFNIPVFNKRSYMKDAVQRQVAINKYSASQRDVISKTEGTQQGLKNKIDQYEAMASSDYFKVLKEMKKLLVGSRNNSPLMIIETNVKLAKEKLKRLELRQDITVEYLESLLHSGTLNTCENPSFLVRR